MLSFTEENYLKALLKLTLEAGMEKVGTNDLASTLSVKPASVTDMLKKLKEKQFIHYEKYGKIHLTAKGKQVAVDIVRKHRLWETFLCLKLGFAWDEVHEIAEQLEHIQSETLIDRLDQFLDYPRFDPHGDPIPKKNGELPVLFHKTLSQVPVGVRCKMVAVKDNSTSFLQYVAEVGLALNKIITIISKQDYDGQIIMKLNGENVAVSEKFSDNVLVVCTDCDTSHTCHKTSCPIQ